MRSSLYVNGHITIDGMPLVPFEGTYVYQEKNRIKEWRITIKDPAKELKPLAIAQATVRVESKQGTGDAILVVSGSSLRLNGTGPWTAL